MIDDALKLNKLVNTMSEKVVDEFSNLFTHLTNRSDVFNFQSSTMLPYCVAHVSTFRFTFQGWMLNDFQLFQALEVES